MARSSLLGCVVAWCALMTGLWAGEASIPAVPTGGAPAMAQTGTGFRIGSDAETARFVAERIMPVFAKHCFECHGGKKKFGGLKMDTLEGAQKGGHDFGPGITPWNPDKSSIVVSMRWAGEDEDMHMPPKKKLPDEVIADATRWVAMGAPWPDAVDSASATAVSTAAVPRPPLLGRMHPALVHLPIAALVLAVLFGLLELARGHVWRPAMRVSLGMAVLGGVPSLISGVLLAGGQDPVLLSRHEWAAWISIILALIALVVDLAARDRAMVRWVSRLFLLAALVAVALAGHWGGDMVHGSWF